MRNANDAMESMDEPEEPELTVESLENARYTRWRPLGLRPLLNLVSAVLAVALVLVGVGAALSTLRTHSADHTGTVRAMSKDVQFARRLVGTVPRGAGWRRAAPAWAQTIAFAASAPGVAYTCGVPGVTLLNRPAQLAIGVSDDGGRSWRPYATQAAGIACDMTVDPTDPRDVVLVANTDPFTNTRPLVLYRTVNGGATWSSLPLPPRADGGRDDFFAYQWTWVNPSRAGQRSTFYLAPYFPDGTIYVWLAASVAGDSLTWVTQHALFPGQPPDGGVATIIGVASALYMVLRSRTNCPPSCMDVERTTDGGLTWERLALSFAGASVSLLPGATSDLLFGRVATNTPDPGAEYVYSTNAGASWVALTALPVLLAIRDILRAPDGTLFALLDAPTDGDFEDEGQPGIYALAPGGGSWRFVASFSSGALSNWEITGPFEASGPSIALAWDGSGHATTLWGAAHQQTADGIQPGLEYHAV